MYWFPSSSLMQSHPWQSIAALPKKDFEGYIREHKQGQKEITTAGALKLCKAEQSKIQTTRLTSVKTYLPGKE